MRSPFLFLEKFELLSRGVGRNRFAGGKYFHHTELFIGDTKNPYVAQRRQKHFYSFYVYLGIFATGAVAHINGKLKLGESVAHKLFAEVGVCFSLFLGIGRQVEKNKYPHDTIFTETVEFVVHISG